MGLGDPYSTGANFTSMPNILRAASSGGTSNSAPSSGASIGVPNPGMAAEVVILVSEMAGNQGVSFSECNPAFGAALEEF